MDIEKFNKANKIHSELKELKELKKIYVNIQLEKVIKEEQKDEANNTR